MGMAQEVVGTGGAANVWTDVVEFIETDRQCVVGLITVSPTSFDLFRCFDFDSVVI